MIGPIQWELRVLCVNNDSAEKRNGFHLLQLHKGDPYKISEYEMVSAVYSIFVVLNLSLDKVNAVILT